MELDQLLTLTSTVAGKLLPIAGVVVLIYLAIFVKHLVQLMKTANEAACTMNKTLETANKELEALEKPLNTLNELSETVDCIHDASKNAVRYSLTALFENFSSIKDWVFSHNEREKQDASCTSDKDPIRENTEEGD